MLKKIKGFLSENSKVSKLVMALAIVCSFAAVSVGATDPVVPDMTTTMTTAITTIVANTLSAIAAVAPIGITIFGAMFLWKKGLAFFNKVAK